MDQYINIKLLWANERERERDQSTFHPSFKNTIFYLIILHSLLPFPTKCLKLSNKKISGKYIGKKVSSKLNIKRR